jgi:hypothetical protein
MGTETVLNVYAFANQSKTDGFTVSKKTMILLNSSQFVVAQAIPQML